MPQKWMTIKRGGSVAPGWLRLYRDIVFNSKPGMLTDRQFRAWVNCLCICDPATGVLPSQTDIAWHLRMSFKDAEDVISELIECRLIDVADPASRKLVMHEWTDLQFLTDSSKERTKRYRDKRTSLGLPRSAQYDQFRTPIRERDGIRCAYCGEKKPLVVEHMVPISQSGTDALDNLCLACKSCNSGKSGRTPEQAGMSFAVKSAEAAYRRYLSFRVTVTAPVTPPVTRDIGQLSPSESVSVSDSESVDRDSAYQERILSTVEEDTRGAVSRVRRGCAR